VEIWWSFRALVLFLDVIPARIKLNDHCVCLNEYKMIYVMEAQMHVKKMKLKWVILNSSLSFSYCEPHT